MKRFLAMAGLLVGLTSVANAQSALPVFEPFNYTLGTTLTIAPSTPWTATGALADITSLTVSSASSLPYAGLGGANTGGRTTVRNGGSFQDIGIDFTPPVTTDGDSIYVSAVINVTTISATAAGDYILHVSGAGSAAVDFRSRIYILPGSVAATTFRVGLRGYGGVDTTTILATDLTVGTNYFIVFSYDRVAGADNDAMRLWVNPALGLGAPPTADISRTVGGTGQDIASVGRVGLRQGSATAATVLDLDTLRIGSWTQVTPTNAKVNDWSQH